MHPLKDKKQSPEHIEKRRQAMLKYWHDPAWRKRHSEATAPSNRTPERREMTRRLNLGKPLSPETREKLRQATLRQWEQSGDEMREQLRKVHGSNKYRLGKGHGPKTREKIRQARLRQRPFPKKATIIEIALEHEFRKRRLRFEMNKTMFSRWQPDFVFGSANLIVQADGDYWHRRRPEQLKKDARFNKAAAQDGWTVWRFSETEIIMHPEACAKAVARFIRSH